MRKLLTTLLALCLVVSQAYAMPKNVVLRNKAGFSPKQLAPVLWLDSDRSTLTQSNGLISAWADKSGNGYTFAQSADANKPYLTRSDSLENRLLQSNGFDTTWVKSNITATIGQTDPLGGSNAWRLQETAAGVTAYQIYQTSVFEVVNGATYTWSFYAKAAERKVLAIYLENLFSTSKYSKFDVSAGTVTDAGDATTPTIEAVGAGWFRITISATATSSGSTARVSAYICDDSGTISHAGDAAKGLNIYGAQLRRTSTSSTYLATTTYPQYAGLSGRAVPYFPVSLSWMNQALPAALDLFVGNNTVFAVVNLDGSSDASANFTIAQNESASTKGFVYRINGSDMLPTVITYDGSAHATYATSPVSQATTTLLSFVKNGTSGSYYKNGASDGAVTQANAVTAAGNQIAISRYNAASLGLRGYLPELIVFNRALSAGERSLVETYLRRKWRM